MRRQYHPLSPLRLVLLTALLCILLPLGLLLLWCVTGRWPWPGLLPESYSLRTLRELLFGSASLPRLLGSSIALAGVVAVLGTGAGLCTARAVECFSFPGRGLVRAGSLLPLLVPGTVFAMGIQVTLIRLGLSDTVAGVVIVHLMVAFPYSCAVLGDMTRAVGLGLEEQAMVLGAGPWRAFLHGTLPALLPGILSSMSICFILSYSQYFTTLMVGGGRVQTIALVLVPYIQSGDRPLSAVYSAAFSLSALGVFFLFEALVHRAERQGEERWS